MEKYGFTFTSEELEKTANQVQGLEDQLKKDQIEKPINPSPISISTKESK